MAKKATVGNTVGENSSGIELVGTDTNGQGRIPGTEVPVVKEIQQFVQRHEDTKFEHKRLTEQLTGENAEAIELFRKHEQHFAEDDKGNYVYSDPSGARLEIVKPGEFKVKTSIDATVEAAVSNGKK